MSIVPRRNEAAHVQCNRYARGSLASKKVGQWSAVGHFVREPMESTRIAAANDRNAKKRVYVAMCLWAIWDKTELVHGSKYIYKLSTDPIR